MGFYWMVKGQFNTNSINNVNYTFVPLQFSPLSKG